MAIITGWIQPQFQLSEWRKELQRFREAFKMEEEETTSAAEDNQFAKLMHPFSAIPSGGELRFTFCFPDSIF